MIQAINLGWAPIIPLIAEKWSKMDTDCDDPLEIIKAAKDIPPAEYEMLYYQSNETQAAVA